MVKKSLLFDADECIGCFACEVACKQEHNIPAGEHWIRIFKVGPTRIGGRLTMDFAALHCMHCGKPSCMKACPEGAISKRYDGIVLFNKDLCTGCKVCIEACPFGAPQYNPEKDIVEACNLCFERVDEGLLPSCVHHCPTHALYFGDCNIFPTKMPGKRSNCTVEKPWMD
jgi:Fe-S-cluster-containing dehydrogenase component